ncbi:hypothetical protein [Vibrio alginolyticus]|nr:hypothetical protein [Vibrio alginolyticus]
MLEHSTIIETLINLVSRGVHAGQILHGTGRQAFQVFGPSQH